jgi:dCMP deaminase
MFGHILATGYNGAAAGMAHCIDEPCAGANYPSGEGLEFCNSLHAEQNALIRCREPDRIYTAYVTTSPCIHCTKMLLNTTCQEIQFIEPYTDPLQLAAKLWLKAGRKWTQAGPDRCFSADLPVMSPASRQT